MKKSILIFGLGFLQRSIIEQCKKLGLYTIGVDITDDPECRDEVDAFEVAAGDDFDATLAIAKKYNILGVITAATDKPLVMMARIAEVLHLPFYSVDTATWSTDKLLMKERFQKFNVPCAKGFLLNNVEDLKFKAFEYPVIVKPRDNSGSRGVIYCKSEQEVLDAMKEALQYSKQTNVLVEEYIEGQEYSIESIHYEGKSQILQFTQKITTEFPYNVELGHIQPADLAVEQKENIKNIINKISEALNFDNCASHTELKINSKGITVIETSPRLGGDFITSHLVPLSTGINMENLLVKMSIGYKIAETDLKPLYDKSSGVIFFELPEGKITSISNLDEILNIKGCVGYQFDLKVGDTVNKITSSLNRYGWAIINTKYVRQLIIIIEKIKRLIYSSVVVN